MGDQAYLEGVRRASQTAPRTLAKITALTLSGNLDFHEERPCPHVADGGISDCEDVMGKGDNKRGNKEVKKPKQEKPKVLATANSGAAAPVSLGAKKRK